MIPHEGDRIFFVRPARPLSRSVHFNWIGLAEVASVTPTDDPDRPLIGFRTITPLHAFVPRGGDSWERIEQPAIAVTRRVGSWGALNQDEALALFRYVKGIGDVALPAWFAESEILLQEPQDHFDPHVIDERRRALRLIVERQGQGLFRAALLNAYDRRCAMTGCDVEGVLEAAHIVPYLGPNTNNVTNGLLLRADLHTLFDLNVIAVDPDRLTIQVSPTLQTSEYWRLNGAALRLPSSTIHRPAGSAFRERQRLLQIPAVRDVRPE